MATKVIGAWREWSGERDDEGHRTWKIVFLVESNSKNDGPASAMVTAGLPLPGSIWNFGNDLDIWAFCRPGVSIKPRAGKSPNLHWELGYTFSTKPYNRCQDAKVENPLLEPPKISGTFKNKAEEATDDLFGPILNSAHEQMRGAQVEFDIMHPSIKIEQNVATQLQAIALPAALANSVNSHPLWGPPPRTIKLVPSSWERKYYGQCFSYYARTLEFEINYETWDRSLLDEGQMVINGHWDKNSGLWVEDDIAGNPPNHYDPTHYIRSVDRKGEPMKVVLNGNGAPYIPTTGATTITPATSLMPLGSVPDILLNRLYTNAALPATTSAGGHFYKISKGGDVLSGFRLAVMAAPNAALSAGNVFIYLYDAATGTTISPSSDNTYNPSTLECVIPNGSGPVIIQLHNATAAPIAYSLRVDGEDPDNAPGKISVYKYPSGNFLLLGIPMIL